MFSPHGRRPQQHRNVTILPTFVNHSQNPPADQIGLALDIDPVLQYIVLVVALGVGVAVGLFDQMYFNRVRRVVGLAADVQRSVFVIGQARQRRRHQTFEDAVYAGDDVPAAAEVLAQRDAPACAFLPAGLRDAPEKYGRVRQAKAVDTLFDVADAEQIALPAIRLFAADHAQDRVLNGVDVLVLIDQYVGELVLHRAGNVAGAAVFVRQQGVRELFQIAEVQRMPSPLGRRVFVVQFVYQCDQRAHVRVDACEALTPLRNRKQPEALAQPRREPLSNLAEQIFGPIFGNDIL